MGRLLVLQIDEAGKITVVLFQGTLVLPAMSMFSNGTDTLYGWTPSSIGAYAGTCLFLVILAISRFLIAFRSVLENHQCDVQLGRWQEPVISRPQSSGVLLKDNWIEEIVVVRHNVNSGDTRHWMAIVDGRRAAVSTILAGVLYLFHDEEHGLYPLGPWWHIPG